jgi:hypothetical protein
MLLLILVVVVVVIVRPMILVLVVLRDPLKQLVLPLPKLFLLLGIVTIVIFKVTFV